MDLKNRIITGDLLPGVHLIESDLMHDYKVSRTSIREALHSLADDEIVERITNRGIRVRKLSLSELKNYYMIMEYLNGLAIKLAAINRKDSDLQKLSRILKSLKDSLEKSDFTKYADGVLEYHDMIARASDNAPLRNAIEKYQLITRIPYAVRPLEIRMEKSYENHVGMLKAIQDKDSEKAETIMRKHMQDAIDLISAKIEFE